MTASHGPIGPHTTQGRKVLVTGAGGQVGLDLLQALRARGDQVFASDLATPSGDAGLGLPWSSLDVTQAAQVDALFAERGPTSSTTWPRSSAPPASATRCAPTPSTRTARCTSSRPRASSACAR
ncbi:sugar nucleotide-binding protein [Nannocystis pusilla]|uniref:Sugar nucleotide-binding protein n=1 Tax=Nannocystis pusilla TaxID=889268 RepID=A0A9X3EJD9_9BACT|nr:sugar nucleotide-binding protein [Nannocystis pusilla]